MKILFKISLLVTFVFVLTLSLFAQNHSPLEITFQPFPVIPKDYGTLDVQGTITVRVEFLANGQIGKVFPINSLTNDLNEKAIEAVKKIEFKPVVKDNQPTTIIRQIQYLYSWEYGWKIARNKWNEAAKSIKTDEKAEAVIKRAVEKLGGDRYLQVKNLVSTGYFTLFRGGTADIPSFFIDVIVYPDKERTEFKQLGNKTVQTNSGEKGWLYDGGNQNLREQNPREIENFKRGIRTSIDTLLRGIWRNQGATLAYVGRREAGIGKRNEVVKLTYPDGFVVEYEFSATDGLPMKSVFKGKGDDETELKEEDRYAQFIEIQGIYVPFIVDHFIDGKQSTRINYEKLEFNKNVPDSIFNKPSDVKELKKDLKL